MIQRVLLALALVASAVPLSAQSLPPAAPTTDTGGAVFFPRFAFHLNAEHLSSDDRRFVWDTSFGGELDFVQYRQATGTFYADYQAMLGEEFRKFDPSHGNYVLGGLATARVAGVEVGGGLHHVSRHMSDRAKRFAIDWNMLGVRIARTVTRGSLVVEARADVRGVIYASYVDYDWEFDAGLRLRQTVRPGIGLLLGSGVRLVGTDGSQGRGRQTGFREEGGVRLDGRGAAAELFVAVERRIDPSPLEFGTATWFTAGFRLLSR